MRENDEHGHAARPSSAICSARCDRLQAVGIWPSGDYRLKPAGGMLTLTYVLIALAIAAAVAGIVWWSAAAPGCRCSTSASR